MSSTSQNPDFSNAVVQMLSELWDKSPRPKPADQSKYQKIVDKAIDWIHLLRHKGLDGEIVAQDLYDRCRLEEPLLESCGLFREDRATTISRIKRALSGVSQLFEKELPSELRQRGAATFQIQWDNEPSGQWLDAPNQNVCCVRTVVLSAIQMFGEFTPTICPLLTDRVLRDLRSGVLVIPNFRRGGSSDAMVTTLEWVPPGLDLSEDDSVLLDDDQFDFTSVLPDEEELAFWKENREKALLFDKILCTRAVQNFHGSST